MTDYVVSQINRVLDDGPDEEIGGVFRLKIVGASAETHWLSASAEQVQAIREILRECEAMTTKQCTETKTHAQHEWATVDLDNLGASETYWCQGAGPRPLKVIAADIREHWATVYFGAVPYLEAMAALDTLADDFGQDDAKSIVLYFLSNAKTWRGPDAQRIKAELKAMVK